MLKDLFRRKPMDQLVAEAEQPEHRLKKALGPVDVTALGIGAIIGAGIFATIGTAAAGDATRPGAGPGLILSFMFTAVACGFAALCYAEFAAMIPISGSAYTYVFVPAGDRIRGSTVCGVQTCALASSRVGGHRRPGRVDARDADPVLAA